MQTPVVSVGSSPADIVLFDLGVTLAGLNQRYPLCRFVMIPGFAEQLRSGKIPVKAKVKAFMCWNHAPNPTVINERFCRYIIKSKRAITHANMVVAAANAAAVNAAAVNAAPANAAAATTALDIDDDVDGDDDDDNYDGDDNDDSDGDNVDPNQAFISADRELIVNWLNRAEIDRDGVHLAQLKNNRKACSTAADWQALLLDVITTTEVGVTLGMFVYQVFYRTSANTGTARAQLLSGFARLCRFYPSALWMSCGKVFADCLMNRPEPWQGDLWTKANKLKEARKLMIDSLFHVLRAAGASASLSPLQGRAALRENDRLRNALRAAIPAGHWSAFLGHVRVATMVALPLDLTYAVFAQEGNWYSERHYRMLQAACSLGLVSDQVRALVGTLENGVAALEITAHAHGKERAPTKEQMLAEIEATMMAQVDLVTMPDRSNDMMNKRYEWIVALMSDFETELSPFTTPLFWWRVEGADPAPVETLRLHYIDMNEPIFSLRLCDALHMNRVL